MFRSALRRLAGRLTTPPRSNPPASPPDVPTPKAEAPPELGPPPQVEVSPEDVRAWREAGFSVVLVDIREPYEVHAFPVPDTVHIPMNQIPSRLDSLPPADHLVLFCAHAERSFDVAHYLREQGISHAWSLAGGAPAWETWITEKCARG